MTFATHNVRNLTFTQFSQRVFAHSYCNSFQGCTGRPVNIKKSAGTSKTMTMHIGRPGPDKLCEHMRGIGVSLGCGFLGDLAKISSLHFSTSLKK